MQSVQITPLLGLPLFDGWSQVFISPEKNLVWAFAIKGQNAGNVGRDLLSELTTIQHPTTAELHRFIVQLHETVRQKECELHLAVLCFSAAGDGQVIAGACRGLIALKRGTQRVGLILRSEGELQLVEGTYKPEDTLVLATQQASVVMDEIQLKLRQGYEPDTIIASVVPAVHEATNSSLTALAFIAPTDTYEKELSERENDPIALEQLVSVGDGVNKVDEVEADSLENSNQPKYGEAEIFNNQVFNNHPESGSAQESQLVKPTSPGFSTEGYASESNVSSLKLNQLNTQQVNAFSQLMKRVGNQGVAVASAVIKKIYVVSKQVVRQALASTDRWRSPQAVYVRTRTPRQLMRIILPIVIVVLVGLAAWGVWSSRQQQQKAAAQTALAPMVAQLDQAKNLVNTDVITARSLTEQTIQQLNTLQTEFSSKPAGQKLIKEQITTAQSFFDQISGQEKVNELPKFYDLNLAQAGFLANTAELTGDVGIFLDSERKQVTFLELLKKQVSVKELAGLEKPSDLAVVDSQVWVLGQGLAKTALPATSATPAMSTAAAQVMLANNDTLTSSKFIDTFNSNLYVFSPEKRNIFRLSLQSDTVSSPSAWLRSSAGVDLSQVASFTIDGDIWLGMTTGKIHKFTSGKVSEFAVTGLTEPFASTVVLYTKPELKNLYVLEPDKQRLVVLTKQGGFLREVKNATLGSATSLVVSEKLAKALLVSGSLIFEVGL